MTIVVGADSLLVIVVNLLDQSFLSFPIVFSCYAGCIARSRASGIVNAVLSYDSVFRPVHFVQFTATP